MYPRAVPGKHADLIIMNLSNSSKHRPEAGMRIVGQNLLSWRGFCWHEWTLDKVLFWVQKAVFRNNTNIKITPQELKNTGPWLMGLVGFSCQPAAERLQSPVEFWVFLEVFPFKTSGIFWNWEKHISLFCSHLNSSESPVVGWRSIF